MTPPEASGRAILEEAAGRFGLDAQGAELIRLGENALWRLPAGVVVRIGQHDQDAAAAKEVGVARWLADGGVAAVRVLDGLHQPVNVAGRPVTFWQELPPHEPGTVVDVAVALRAFHRLAPPTIALPKLAPFVRLAERIQAATSAGDDDRAWLLDRLDELRQRYANLPPGLPHRVVHGDAWRGNIARLGNGHAVLLDFERVALGPPEWDLTSTAVSYTSTGWLDAEQWKSYCDAYGHDVTRWEGYAVLRDIRELRMTTMAVQVAERDPGQYARQAAHRIACLRGHSGPRPWRGWHAVP
ncbi:aminoglycoside phosphotransferase family protein [Crossiella sp. SN42]|uniref:phosphotransferase family protein n=1 Tax=Crossiella sp. SN42 TaxID=2944808 RepID=UPI00207CE929|nr:phosphotransferase [Crossiella sp. SN42]MCO1575502.1 aminoglycoside phosphotransferase family protein [Crossiella sp. SN42]